MKRLASEKTRHQQEIIRLEEVLKEFRGGKRQENVDLLKAENREARFSFQVPSNLLMYALAKGADPRFPEQSIRPHAKDRRPKK